MYKFVVLAALVACVAADAPTSYARGEPLGLSEYNAPSAPAPSFSSSNAGYSSGGDSSDGAQLDEGLLRQITQILGSSSGSSSGSSGYAAPAPQPQPQYNAPQQQGGYSRGPARSGGAIQLGRPEVAQRVAEFEISDNTRQSSQSYGAPPQTSGGY